MIPNATGCIPAAGPRDCFLTAPRRRTGRVPAAAGVPVSAVVAIPSQPVGPAAALVRDWLAHFVCRNLGTTALHLALVATGELDGMLADNPRLWDIAAGWVLLARGGAVATGPLGEALFPLDVAGYHRQKLPMLATRPELYERLRRAAAASGVRRGSSRLAGHAAEISCSARC